MAKRSVVLLALAACAGCTVHLAPEPGVTIERVLTLNGHAVRLHMFDPLAPGPRPLLVYATGDRGWAGKDLDAYRALAAWRAPIVGFDAHDYVKHLGAGTTTPGKLAHDYQAIIAAARDALHLNSGIAVILVGVSRGAGLAVIAAGAPDLQSQLRGVLAIGLTKEEEYVRWYRRIGLEAGRRPPVMVEVYEYLPLLGTLPVAVIQSTRDNYLPAGAARILFGADTERRRFTAIDARNHSFAGSRTELYQAMWSSLTWLVGEEQKLKVKSCRASAARERDTVSE